MSSGNNKFPSSWSEGNALRLKKYYMEQTACATHYFDAGKIVYYVKADGPTSTWVCIWEDDQNTASDPLPAELKWADFLRPFFRLAPHDPVVYIQANFTFLVLIDFPIFLPLVLIFPLGRVDLLVPPTERKEGQTLLPLLQFWILVALLICCSARNTAHVGDLYPASFNSSVRLVSEASE